MFTGSIVALVTPFRNSLVDFEALKNLINWHIDSGTDGILVCGTTGEGSLLSTNEREEVIKKSVEFSGGRVPIIVGCSTESTEKAIQLVKQAEFLKADGVLVIVPFYVKPTQSGIIEHFREVHENSYIPIVMYNNPGRCAVSMSVQTVVELSKLDRIVALKDSDTNLSRATLIKSLAPKLKLLSADDPTLAGYLAHGGDGAMSVTANIEPALVKGLIKAWKDRDIDTMQKINEKLAPLSDVLFIESNPIPIKYALHKKGFLENSLIKPLTPASEKTMLQIDQVMKNLTL